MASATLTTLAIFLYYNLELKRLRISKEFMAICSVQVSNNNSNSNNSNKNINNNNNSNKNDNNTNNDNNNNSNIPYIVIGY